MKSSLTVAVSVAAGAVIYHVVSKLSAFSSVAKTLADGSSREIILACRYGPLYKKGNLRASNNIAGLDLNDSGDLHNFVKFTAKARPCLPFDPQRPFAKPIDIRAEHVVQGAYGNCAVMAVLAGIADTHPEQIESMIKQFDDRRYAVSLFNSKGEPVEILVLKSELTSKRFQNITTDIGRPWPRLIAIALEKLTRMDTNINGHATTTEGAWPESYLNAIYGSKSPIFSITTHSQDFGEYLKDDPGGMVLQYGDWISTLGHAFDEKNLPDGRKYISPVLSIVPKTASDSALIHDGFAAHHSMSIHRVLIDYASPETAYLEVRNVWTYRGLQQLAEPLRGPKSDRKIGEFDLHTLRNFLQDYGDLALRVDRVRLVIPPISQG